MCRPPPVMRPARCPIRRNSAMAIRSCSGLSPCQCSLHSMPIQVGSRVRGVSSPSRACSSRRGARPSSSACRRRGGSGWRSGGQMPAAPVAHSGSRAVVGREASGTAIPAATTSEHRRRFVRRSSCMSGGRPRQSASASDGAAADSTAMRCRGIAPVKPESECRLARWLLRNSAAVGQRPTKGRKTARNWDDRPRSGDFRRSRPTTGVRGAITQQPPRRAAAAAQPHPRGSGSVDLA